MSKEIKPKTIAEYERETTEQRIQIAISVHVIPRPHEEVEFILPKLGK